MLPLVTKGLLCAMIYFQMCLSLLVKKKIMQYFQWIGPYANLVFKLQYPWVTSVGICLTRPPGTPKQKGKETSGQSSFVFSCQNNVFLAFLIFNLLYQSQNLPQLQHLTAWDFHNSGSCIEWWSGDRWQVAGDSWQVKGNMWQVKGVRWNKYKSKNCIPCVL